MRHYPDGMSLTPNAPGDFLGKRVPTPSGKVQLAPEALLSRVSSLQKEYDRELMSRDALKLIQKRERFSHNTWAHNVAEFVKGARNTNYLYMHPDDAAERGLSDGAHAKVSANGHSIELPVKIDESLMLGAICVPHGWGHQQAEGLQIARTTQGANVNIIMPDGPSALEPYSGMAHMNGVIATVSATQ